VLGLGIVPARGVKRNGDGKDPIPIPIPIPMAIPMFIPMFIPIPMPPPIPLICAFLLIGIAVQICLGYRSPWVPAIVRNRSLAQKDVKAATAKAIPLLLRLERISQPRLQWFGHERAMVAIGALIMTLSFGLLTAAPFIGQIPWGLAVCLVGLGLIERDGMLVIAAIALGALGAVLSASFIYALFITLTTLF